MRVVTAPAVGICHRCGIGVCMRHGHRANAPGAPFLCDTCARAAAEPHAHPEPAAFLESRRTGRVLAGAG